MPTPLFKKGRAKTGGRKPGVKNKKSVLQAAFDEVLTPSIAKSLIAAAIRQATTGDLDKPQANLLLGLMPFMAVAMPKLLGLEAKAGD